MRVVDAAGTLRLPLLALEMMVSAALFEVIVLSEEAPTTDTPILPAPGNRVTACFFDSKADIEEGTVGSVANLTFRPSFAAEVRAKDCPIVGVTEFLAELDSAFS